MFSLYLVVSPLSSPPLPSFYPPFYHFFVIFLREGLAVYPRLVSNLPSTQADLSLAALWSQPNENQGLFISILMSFPFTFSYFMSINHRYYHKVSLIKSGMRGHISSGNRKCTDDPVLRGFDGHAPSRKEICFPFMRPFKGPGNTVMGNSVLTLVWHALSAFP